MRVFYASPWILVEWIEAHGLQPRGVWSLRELTSGPLPIAEGVCPFAEGVLRLAEANPESAMIFPTTCDQMRRGFDAVAALGRASLFLFNVPATWQTPAARRLYHAEIRRLGGFLEQLGGHTPTPAELHAVMRDFDARRAELRSFMTHGTARQIAEALASFYRNGTVVGASAEPEHEPPAGPQQSQTGALRRSSGQQAATPPSCAADEAVRAFVKSDRVAPALVGGPVLPSQWALFETVQSAGGCIVLNASEPGGRCLLPPLPEFTDSQDPKTVLADHYFGHCVDVFQRPNTRLYDWLGPRLRSRQVRGIVLWHYTWCDLWRAEIQTLREAFRLPVFPLDADDVPNGSTRDAGRLQAFVETLR